MTASIEAGPPVPGDLSPEELRDWLAKMHGFSPQELQANREGRLSPAQTAFQIQSGLLTFGLIGLLCLVAGGLFGYATVTSLRANEFSRSVTVTLVALAVAGALVPLLILGPFLLPKAVRQLLDGAQGHAEMARGSMQTTTTQMTTRRSGTTSTIWYTVNGLKLETLYNVNRRVVGLDAGQSRLNW
jgi:hypothetical protein